MKIGFVGCGAIGSCYASYLSKVHEVCVLDTYAPVIEDIRQNGILLAECVPGDGNGETVSYRPAMATTDPKEIGVVDLLIVFVHYQYLEAAVRNALPMIDRHTMILCLQNGLGNYDEIAKVVPEEQIIIGNTAFGSTPIEPGHVRHTGTGVTNMGSLKAPMENVERMAEGLRAAGLEVQVHENVMNAIWHKLLANVAINGMSALLETKNGFVDANPYAHEAARMLVEEAIVVANACGCTLEHDAELEHAFEVARMTDETISSMVRCDPPQGNGDPHHHRCCVPSGTGASCPHPLQRSAFAVGFGQAVHLSGPLSKAGAALLEASGGKYLAVWRLFHVPYGSSFLTQSAFCTMLYIVAYKERSKLP